VQFAAALTVQPAINQLVATTATVAPVLHLMLGVGLGQAAQGDPRTFSAAWAAAVQAGLVTSEVTVQMQQLAVAFNLPEDFVVGLAR
jgi:hypothetical protein